ncbi:MAG: hypothetical protein H7124_01365 [Phycisphaerales bacterium]|nr:hypothetical protein [Hyphomonadaceae bacterium]
MPPSEVGRHSSLDKRLLNAAIAVIRREPGAFVSRDAIELHDHRFVALIADQLRRAIDEVLYCDLGWEGLNRAVEAERFVIDRSQTDELLPLVLSVSGRGYIRESAVRNVRSVTGPFALTLLVQRLNDWVPQVRAAAEAKLATLVPTLRPSVITGCIETLWRFEGVGRASLAGRELVQALVHIANDVVGARDWLLQVRGDRAVGLVHGLLRTGVADEHMARVAQEHGHPRVRAIAAKAILEGVYSWRARTTQRRGLPHRLDRQSLALSLLNDRSVDVQYWALHYLAQHDSDAVALEPILKRYLLHPRIKLSELARWKLNKRGVDWLSWVRREFAASPRDLRLAKLLGRVGTAEDGDALWQSALGTAEDRRAVFLMAAAQLQHALALAELETLALADSDLPAARRVTASLLEAKALIPIAGLREATRQGEVFIKRGLLAHVRRHDVLTQLEIFSLLEAAGSVPEPTEFARLNRKINRGRLEVTPDAIERLRRLSEASPRTASWMRRLQIL